MIDHFFFYFALLIEKLKRISVKVAYSAALMFRNVNICGSEGVLVFIGVDTSLNLGREYFPKKKQHGKKSNTLLSLCSMLLPGDVI